MQLTVDTSWWTRYRSDSQNPDFGDTFPRPSPTSPTGSTRDSPQRRRLTPPTTSRRSPTRPAFISPGSSKAAQASTPSFAQRHPPEVLRILLSIGRRRRCTSRPGTTRRATRRPHRSDQRVTFPDLNRRRRTPRPTSSCPSRRCSSPAIPLCSIIRPTETKGAAMGAAQALQMTDFSSGNDGVLRRPERARGGRRRCPTPG